MNHKILAGFVISLCLLGSVSPAAEEIPAFSDNTRILFQGDSITDGGRGRSADPNHILGQDYAYLIAAEFGAKFPERHLTFLNRGISGNKVSDLLKRWQSDTIALRPDVLSILIGVNDLNGGVSEDDFEKQYDQLLEQTFKDLPHARVVLCEPFGLPSGKKKAEWETYKKDLSERQTIVGKLADKYHLPIVHLQKVFDDACAKAPAEYWIWDGVHPTYSGHQLMADEWEKTVSQAWGAKPAEK